MIGSGHHLMSSAASTGGGSTPLTITYIGFDGITSSTGINGTISYTSPTLSLTTSETLIFIAGTQSTTSDWNYLTTATVNATSATKVIGTDSPGGYSGLEDRYSAAMYSITGLTVSSSTVSVEVDYLGSDVARSGCYFYKVNNNSVVVEDTFATRGQTSSDTVSGAVTASASATVLAGGSSNVAFSDPSGTLDTLYTDPVSYVDLFSGYAEDVASSPHTVTLTNTGSPAFVIASLTGS